MNITSHIVTLGAGASKPERHAARELAGTLAMITGRRTAVVAPARAGRRPCIAVGAAAAAAIGLPPSAWRGLGDEGFVMRTLGPNLVLSGAPAAPRGTLYAVVTFLEDILGCRWWTPDAARIPRLESIEIPRLRRRHVPRFEYREVLYRHTWEARWAVRNRTNGLWERDPAGIPAEWGGHHEYAGFVHTVLGLAPPDKYFAAHPEWYAEVDGERKPTQLCLTNRGVLAVATEQVRARLRSQPSATIVSVSQNDNWDKCTCAACRAVDRREGSSAGSMLRFVNRIAAAIEKEFPRVSVDTLAYQYTRRAPRHVRPRRNVIVRLCSFECDFLHPFTHDNNRSFRRDIAAWSRIARRLYVWDYVTNYAHFVQPYPNWYALGENMRFFARHRVAGVFEQANNSSLGGELAELRAWVLAKLMWDPTRDSDALIAEFLDGYYGPAAGPIAAHMRNVHRRAASVKAFPGSPAIQQVLARIGDDRSVRTGCYLDLNSPPTAPYLAPDVVFRSAAHLEAAVAAVRRDSTLRPRAELARLPIWYIALLRWDELRAHARRRGIRWPFPARRLALFERFAAVHDACGITHLGEGWSHRNLPWLRAICAGQPDTSRG